MLRGYLAVPLSLVTLAALAGCGNETVESTPTVATTVPSSTEPATTVPPSTSAVTPATTVAPSTTSTVPSTVAVSTSVPTVPPATGAPTTPPTTVPPTLPVATGWRPTDFEPAVFVVGYSGNYEGSPSPAAPAAGAAPADGYYDAVLLERWEPGDTRLQIRVGRYDECSVLPAGTCFDNPGVVELGVDPAWSLDLDVPLDAGTGVVVRGFSCFGSDEIGAATGADLGELFEAYAADFAAEIEPSIDELMSEYQADPAVYPADGDGFVAATAMCPDDEYGSGLFNYVHADAPVLLLQTLTSWEGDGPLTATDLIRLQGVEYAGGVPTFYFYAGFYS